jgi:hypothetical protein
MASMSEASILFQPRMDDPSKPKPSEKESSLSSPMGMLKCCQVPKVSELDVRHLRPALLGLFQYALGCAHDNSGFVLLQFIG